MFIRQIGFPYIYIWNGMLTHISIRFALTIGHKLNGLPLNMTIYTNPCYWCHRSESGEGGVNNFYLIVFVCTCVWLHLHTHTHMLCVLCSMVSHNHNRFIIYWPNSLQFLKFIILFTMTNWMLIHCERTLSLASGIYRRHFLHLSNHYKCTL